MKNLDKIKKEMGDQLEYALKGVGSCYEGENIEDVVDEVSSFADHIEPIIYEKLEEAYKLGKKDNKK